jgi:hypothetical protein
VPVSIDLQKQIWDDPEPRGQSKLVLQHLASYVSKEAWDKALPMLAWPSQNTIARKCGIPRSSVERALANLESLGKIRDTGRRRQRRTVVWELYPSQAPTVKAGWEYADDLPDSGAGRSEDLPDYGASGGPDMPEGGASEAVLPDYRASDRPVVADLPDPRRDLPDPLADLPDSGAGSCPATGHKREEETRTEERSGKE